MAKEQTPLKQLKEYSALAMCDSPTRTRIPVAMGPFETKHSPIQMVPFFYWLESENPYKHVDAFLEKCSISS